MRAGIGWVALAAVATVALTSDARADAPWRRKLLRELRDNAAVFEGTLQPASSAPSPAWGSPVRWMDRGDGVLEAKVELSTCTQHLKYTDVDASQDFSSVVRTGFSVGGSVAFELVEASGSAGASQVGGVEYHLAGKRVLDPTSVDAYRRCCVQQPDQCADQVITEWWKGAGKYHRLSTTKAAAKVAVKAVASQPSGNFSFGRGWDVSAAWPGQGAGCPEWPAEGWKACAQYFTYRAQDMQVPTCGQYMRATPERDGHTLFRGVAADWASSIQAARSQARADVIRQVATACGVDVAEGTLTGAELSLPGGRVVGIVDSFACEDVEDIGGSFRYLGHSRVYVPTAALTACAAPPAETP